MPIAVREASSAATTAAATKVTEATGSEPTSTSTSTTIVWYDGLGTGDKAGAHISSSIHVYFLQVIRHLYFHLSFIIVMNCADHGCGHQGSSLASLWLYSSSSH